jgi:hypothetical protein
MLKLTFYNNFLTTTHSWQVESNIVSRTISPMLKFTLWPQPISAMLKPIYFTTTNSRCAESDLFFSMTYSKHAETDISTTIHSSFAETSFLTMIHNWLSYHDTFKKVGLSMVGISNHA